MNKGKYQIFISHAGTDTWVAKQIEAHINKCGASTFLDDSDIFIGDDFEKIILKEVKKSEELIVLFTPWAKQRPYVWLEIGAAWALGRRIVGILYGMTIEEISKDGSNPALLKRTNLIGINEIDKYFRQLKKRVESRKTKLV